jgi:RNA polymerase sigma-70 factor (ECF subfamily)
MTGINAPTLDECPLNHDLTGAGDLLPAPARGRGRAAEAARRRPRRPDPARELSAERIESLSRLERARRGDRDATHALVESLRQRITRMAHYYARRSGEDADDLLQEAWLALLDALREVDVSIGTPEQYLIQRARWRVLDQIKRARIRRSAPLDEAVGFRGADGAPDNVAAGASLWEFHQMLSPTQQSIVACLMAGYTWCETGEALGFTPANVAYHVRQIKRRYQDWAAGRPTTIRRPPPAQPGGAPLVPHRARSK